jgi:D-alanine-D-alanine ligase
MPSGETLSNWPIRMLVIAGGPSPEHVVSLMSARNVLEAASKSKKLQPSLLVLTRQGRWLSESESRKALTAGVADQGGTAVPTVALSEMCDVVFPLLDGWEGGAGAVQGILEMEGLPYLGGGIMATVLTRDKIIAKQVLAAHGIPMVRHVAFTREDYVRNGEDIIKQASGFNLPLFVKPANLGSALGVSMVKDFSTLEDAMHTAMNFDRRVLIEEGVKKPRELEVAIMGNHKLYASPVGELVYDSEWNDYDAQYNKQPHVIVPADLPPNLSEMITSMALQIYRLLDCAGYGRIDFFMDSQTEEIYFNEATCSPGFTSKSYYPALMGGAGYGLVDLIESLVKFAFERHSSREEPGRNDQEYGDEVGSE